MADDFDPLMNPEPEPPAAATAPAPQPAKIAVPVTARASVRIDAPAPSFAPPPPPPAQNMFDNLDDDDDVVHAPAPSPAKSKAAVTSTQQVQDADESAAAPAARPRAAVAAAKTVDAASSNASQFTGVSKRGSSLFQGRDSDVLSGGAADIFIPSEARGLQTGIESFVSVQALDDDLLRVNDDDIDSLFAEEPSAAAVGRRDRLALSQPAAGAVGNRNAAVSALFGPKSKVSATTAPVPAHDDDDDDLFGDIGASAATHSGAGAMTELNLQEYIAKQKSSSSSGGLFD